MGHPLNQNHFGRGWMGTLPDEEQPRFGWMDPFGEVRPPQPHRVGRSLRDFHGRPLSIPASGSRQQGWPPISSNNHRRPRHEDDFYLPPTRLMPHSEPTFYYQPLWPISPVIHPYSTLQTVRPLPHVFQSYAPTSELEATTAWEHWPPESLSRRRDRLPCLLHPFLAAAIDCPEVSSSIWDMLDFPTAENALMRWTPYGHRIPVREYKDIEAVATFPPVKLLIIRFGEGIPPLEIAKGEDGREITLMDVLLAMHGHLNGGKDGRGYIPQAILEEFDNDLKAITVRNCQLRRRYLYSRPDSRRQRDPPKWIDVLGDSATKFVRLVFAGGDADDGITCNLEYAPGKVRHPRA